MNKISEALTWLLGNYTAMVKVYTRAELTDEEKEAFDMLIENACLYESIIGNLERWISLLQIGGKNTKQMVLNDLKYVKEKLKK